MTFDIKREQPIDSITFVTRKLDMDVPEVKKDLIAFSNAVPGRIVYKISNSTLIQVNFPKLYEELTNSDLKCLIVSFQRSYDSKTYINNLTVDIQKFKSEDLRNQASVYAAELENILKEYKEDGTLIICEHSNKKLLKTFFAKFELELEEYKL